MKKLTNIKYRFVIIKNGEIVKSKLLDVLYFVEDEYVEKKKKFDHAQVLKVEEISCCQKMILAKINEYFKVRYAIYCL